MYPATINNQISQLRAQLALKVTSTPPPPGGSEIVAAVYFSFTSGILVLGAFPVGAIMDRAQIWIQTPFNGIAPTVRFGVSANPQLFLDGDVAAKTIGQYESEELVSSVPDILLLSVSSSGSTQGAGVLFYRMYTP